MSHKNMQDSKGTRNLSEVFQELEEIRYGLRSHETIETPKSNKSHKQKVKKQRRTFSSIWQSFLQIAKIKLNKREVLKVSAITGSVFVLLFAFVSTNYIFATNEEKQEDVFIDEFETNDNAIVLENIIAQNASMVTTKKVSTEIRDVDFQIEKRESSNLPKGEEKITKEGIKGKDEVEVVRTFANEVMVDEKITNSKRLEEPVTQIVEVGTSEFLSKYKVHIGDYMYVTKDTPIMKGTGLLDEKVGTIKKYLGARLLEAGDEWCKVLYEDTEGYVKSSALNSEHSSPGILEKNRIQRLKDSLDFNMHLNQKSGLTLDDYKRILSNQPSDTYGIFESNAEAFYEAEQKYNINGVFLVAVGIHESDWGTSKISMDKKNLFGYGSFDRDPYNSSYQFTEYSEGIELVAKVFVKYYLNLTGTKIYDNEVAEAKYYNGPTVSGINVRYASDENWAEGVYKHMENLYNQL